MSLELDGSLMQAAAKVHPFDREIAEEVEEAAAAAVVEVTAVEDEGATVEVVLMVEAAGAEKICIAYLRRGENLSASALDIPTAKEREPTSHHT